MARRVLKAEVISGGRLRDKQRLSFMNGVKVEQCNSTVALDDGGGCET